MVFISLLRVGSSVAEGIVQARKLEREREEGEGERERERKGEGKEEGEEGGVRLMRTDFCPQEQKAPRVIAGSVESRGIWFQILNCSLSTSKPIKCEI